MLPMLVYDPERRATAADMLRHPWLERTARPRPGASPAAGRPAPGGAGAMAAAAAAERAGGGSDGGGGEAGLQHAGERRRAYSGRSRSRSASPSGARRSRCAAPRAQHGGLADHLWKRVIICGSSALAGRAPSSPFLFLCECAPVRCKVLLVAWSCLPANASHAVPDVWVAAHCIYT